MKVLSFLLCSLLALSVQAQDFSGYRTSNYSGVSGVFINPANIADSRHRWDFNLFNASTFVGNNKATFRLKDIGRTLDMDSIKHKIFSEGSGSSNGFASAVVQGPSLAFNLNKKSALALTSRARVMMNITDFDGKLAKQIIDEGEDNTGFPYSVASANNMVVNVNGWTEFGVSYAREIANKGNHFLKGGLTVKYLAGAANASINIGKTKATIDYDAVKDDSYLTNASGNIGLNFGGLDIDDFEPTDLLKFKSTGVGADIGFVYEYRPDTAGTLRNSSGEMRLDLNKYKFKISVALLDIGSNKYDRDLSRSGSYNIHVGSNERFYLSALADAGIDDLKDTLNKYPQFFTPDANGNTSSYTVPLPTTLQLNADYHVKKGFYINLASQFTLVNSSTKIYSSQYYNSVALTPRLESPKFGVYLPLTYSSLTEFTAGASFRLGGFFIGSGSILSAAIGNSKQVDFFVGLHFGSLQKNK